MVPRIYLDHNATAPMLPRVTERLVRCLDEAYVNPASQHSEGRRARRQLNLARQEIGRVLSVQLAGPNRDQLIFTSGGTESNNFAIRGLVGHPPGLILVSPIEHPSVLSPVEQLQQLGFQVHFLPVDANGIVAPDTFAELLEPGVRLVSVMLGNNETGVIQPVARLAAICRQRRILFHTDAVQAIGKLPVDFGELGVDALSLTAHKFHGPLGIGALVVRGSVPIQPILWGGAQQMGLRPGTESVPLACGMAEALVAYEEESQPRLERLTGLRDLFEQLVVTACPDAVIHARSAPRLPHTTNLSIPGLDRQSMLMALDRAGVACATGSACTSGSSEPSHVLQAMGCPRELVESSLRFSLGCLTCESDIRLAAERLVSVICSQKTLQSSQIETLRATRENP